MEPRPFLRALPDLIRPLLPPDIRDFRSGSGWGLAKIADGLAPAVRVPSKGRGQAALAQVRRGFRRWVALEELCTTVVLRRSGLHLTE